MDRRELLKASAWSVPVIAAAIATPLTSASEPQPAQNRIRFTNLTATVGKKPNTVYANTKVQVIDGPEQVHGVQVTITFVQGSKTVTHNFDYAVLPGWGATPIIRVEQEGFASGEPVKVFFTATAIAVEMITGSVEVEAPRWWSA